MATKSKARAPTKVQPTGISKAEAAKMDKLFANFDASPAPLTIAAMESIERGLTNEPDGVNRRCGFAILTRTGNELVGWAKGDDAVVLAAAVQAARMAAERHVEIVRMLEAAAARGELALCIREDMDAINAEAEASFAAEAANG